MVSPCPPGRTCVWSGIVTRTGTYTLKGDKILLEPDPNNERGGEPLPTTLGLKNGAVVEDPQLSVCIFNKLR